MKPPKYNVGDIVSYMGSIYACENPQLCCDKCGQVLPGIETKIEKKINGEVVSITAHIYNDSQQIWYGIKGGITRREEDILERV